MNRLCRKTSILLSTPTGIPQYLDTQNRVEYRYKLTTQITTLRDVAMRAYFSGEDTITSCVAVKANTIRNEIVIVMAA